MMKAIVTTILLALTTLSIASPMDTATTVREQINQIIHDLIKDDHDFSDDDAITAAVAILKLFEGEKRDHETLMTRLSSDEQSKTVFVCYDFGIGFRGYEIRFHRYGYLQAITVVPSE